MKLVVIKKGTKKWVAAAPQPAGCCLMVEGSFYPCFEIGLNG